MPENVSTRTATTPAGIHASSVCAARVSELMSGATDAYSPDALLFAKLIAAREVRDELPLFGIAYDRLNALFERHFSRARPFSSANEIEPMTTKLVALKAVEHVEFVTKLRTLLLTKIGGSVHEDDAECLATIIANACLRPDHLWRDLGLDGREDVTQMLERYFPALVARNVDSLRWKKFLARELALSLGLEPGPAPGCPGCEDFRHCFPRN